MKFRTHLTILLLFASSLCFSQVENIKSKAEKDKKKSFSGTSSKKVKSSSRRHSTSQSNYGESLADEIFTGIIRGLGFITFQAQKSVLYDKDRIPNLISAEFFSDYGTTFKESNFNAGARANWGIFGSEISYNNLVDNTGSLKTLNWQILIVRIPIKTFKANYGIGFTTLQDPRITYFESSVGIDYNSNNGKINASALYKWAQRRNESGFRNDFKFTVDYTVFKRKFFNIAPYIGVNYQMYYKDDWFLFGNAGVKIRLK